MLQVDVRQELNPSCSAVVTAGGLSENAADTEYLM